MSIASDIEIVVEHTLRSEDNLRMAAKVSAAFEQVRQQIVAEFMRTLREKMAARLGEPWGIIHYGDEDALTKGDLLEISRKIWNDRCSIVLESATDGPTDLNFYVWVEDISRRVRLVGCL
jgi:hypothetical protein